MSQVVSATPQSAGSAKLIADRIFRGEGVALDVLRIAVANILLVLSAHVVIPLPFTPVPITGQTFGVLLVAVILGSRRGMLTCVLYLLEGMAGLPVFQPLGAPGPLRLAGPTAGYLLAYPSAAFVTGWLAEYISARGFSRFRIVQMTGALVSGEAIIFAGGCAWLALGMRLGWSGAIYAGALPFIPGEIIKIALILAVVRGMELAWNRT